MNTLELVATVAARQCQLVTLWQLRLCGLSERAIQTRIACHGWSRASGSVIALPGPWDAVRHLTLAVLNYSHPHDAELRVQEAAEVCQDRIDALVAAAMTAGQLVCGRSALWLHGIAGAPEKHWIRLPVKSGARPQPRTIVRYGPSTGVISWVQGLPVVDVEQAFMDVSGNADGMTRLELHHDLTQLAAKADALRRTSPEVMRQRESLAPRFVGAPLYRSVVADLLGELAHSATEKKARRIVAEVLVRYGLTLHPRPYTVESNGIKVGEADLAIVACRLDFEVDGPHHLLPAQRDKDVVRDRLMRRAGWEVERFSTRVIDLTPKVFAAHVDECVRARLRGK
jgi:hypothetical protein